MANRIKIARGSQNNPGNSTPTFGNILPSRDNVYDIGSPSFRFANLYANEVHVGTNSVFIGTLALEQDSNGLLIVGTPDGNGGLTPAKIILQPDFNSLSITGLTGFTASTIVGALNELKAGNFVLPTASTTVLGGVKIDGTTITISGGVISGTYTLPAATTSALGGIIVGSGLSVGGDGTLSADAPASTPLNTPSTLVSRDSSGNFAAGQITVTSLAAPGQPSSIGTIITPLSGQGDSNGHGWLNVYGAGGSGGSIMMVNDAGYSWRIASGYMSGPTNGFTIFDNSASAIRMSIDTAGDVNFSGLVTAASLTVTGDFMVNGTMTTVNSTTIALADNVIQINSSQTGTPPSVLTAGLTVNRGTSTAYNFWYDEATQTFRIGQTGSMQAVATRQDSPTSNAIPFWNTTFNRLDSSSVTVSGSTLTGSLTGNASTATKLATTKNINGVAFDGSADITVTTAAGTLTGATLASNVTASSLTTFGANIVLGTPASGTLTNCTIPASAITGVTLASNVVTSSLTTVGTVATGTWSASFGAVSGANLTNLTAANISAGNLASGVNPYLTANTSSSSALLVVFGNATAGGSSAALDVSTALTFTPSTGALAATSFVGSVAAASITGATLAAGVTGSSLTSVGIITAGTWNSAIGTSATLGVISGANLTNLTAANISGGNLGSTVLPYETADIATSTAQYVTFAAASTNGNNGLKVSSTLQYVASTGTLTATHVANATWNDIADCIEVPDDLEIVSGACYVMNDDGTYNPSTKYLDDGIMGIASDTYGFKVGAKEDKNELPIAIGGFVLAFVDKAYKVGTPLTAGPNGALTEILLPDKRDFPEKVIATFWKMEPSTNWNGAEVNGRMWVKVR